MAVNIQNQNAEATRINLRYILVVIGLAFILPLICFIIEHLVTNDSLTIGTFGKWFVFSAGLRLLIAGIKQATDPAFTAKQIFHLQGDESFPVVRELGFANICLGLVAVVSLFVPPWRIVSAFASGLYYGAAGMMHAVKKPAGANEKFALVTDILIFLLLLLYFVREW